VVGLSDIWGSGFTSISRTFGKNIEDLVSYTPIERIFYLCDSIL